MDSLQKTLKERKQRGFTIVELLIVIVIIGILAAIVIVAYNGITESARVSAFADGFKKFEKAMRLYVIDQGYSSWPRDDALIDGVGNPTIEGSSGMITNLSGFKNYMQSAPDISGYSGSWRYDNDGDVYDGCAANARGVNIYVNNFTDSSLAQKIDEVMDDGNTSCGKVRWDGSSLLLYNLSPDGTL